MTQSQALRFDGLVAGDVVVPWDVDLEPLYEAAIEQYGGSAGNAAQGAAERGRAEWFKTLDVLFGNEGGTSGGANGVAFTLSAPKTDSEGYVSATGTHVVISPPPAAWTLEGR